MSQLSYSTCPNEGDACQVINADVADRFSEPKLHLTLLAAMSTNPDQICVSSLGLLNSRVQFILLMRWELTEWPSRGKGGTMQVQCNNMRINESSGIWFTFAYYNYTHCNIHMLVAVICWGTQCGAHSGMICKRLECTARHRLGKCINGLSNQGMRCKARMWDLH